MTWSLRTMLKPRAGMAAVHVSETCPGTGEATRSEITSGLTARTKAVSLGAANHTEARTKTAPNIAVSARAGSSLRAEVVSMFLNRGSPPPYLARMLVPCLSHS